MEKDKGQDCSQGSQDVESVHDHDEQSPCSSTIRRESEKWDAQAWKQYLRSLERARREKLINKYQQLVLHRYIDEETNNSYCFDFYTKLKRDKADLEARVKELVWDLPYEELFVIRSLFYDGLSLRETAERMNKAHSQIVKIRDAAIERLRLVLEGRKPGVVQNTKK